MKILIATHNKDKIKEIVDEFSDLSTKFVTLNDLGEDYAPPAEDGNSYADNALIKAKYYHEKTGLPCISDDSGLEVEALDGEPGIYSARYAGENASYKENNLKLINNLNKIGISKSPAKYVCTLAFFYDDTLYFTSMGVCEGHIKTTPSGHNGFGYDPYFYVEDNVSMADITTAHKAQISHRGQAIRNMRKILNLSFFSSNK